MAVLLDTSGVILVLRRHPPPETASFVAATRAEILGGRAVLPSVAVSDLLVAATAVWLDLPLLTWDGDFARARTQGRKGGNHPGAQAWRRLLLHPASRSA